MAGLHQHYFWGASAPLSVGVNDTLYAYVYLDPANPPSEVMLQWNDGSGWEHRAYWGANKIAWGIDGSASRRYMGPLPAAGKWVRLTVPAAQVGLDGKSVSGMAFTLYDGSATWDLAGIQAGTPPSAANLGRRRCAGRRSDGRRCRGLELDEQHSGAVFGRAGAPVGIGGRPASALFLWSLLAVVGGGQRHVVCVRVPGSDESADTR